MSWEATAYVSKLRECPDGAPLTPEHKLILFCLSNCHNVHKRMAWPSLLTLADDGLCSLSTVKRAIDYLEAHCLLEQHRPERQGRGQLCYYTFLEIDNPERLKVLLYRKSKGVQSEPLFSAGQSSSQGVQKTAQRGSKGVQTEPRIEEVEQGTVREQGSACATDAHASNLLSKAECERRIVRLCVEDARKWPNHEPRWPVMIHTPEIVTMLQMHWPEMRGAADFAFEFGAAIRKAMAN